MLPLLGALVIAASIAAALLLLTVFGTQSDASRIDDFARFVVDGGAEARVDVNSSDTYTLYYEFEGELRDGGHVVELRASPQPPEDLTVRVLDDDENELEARVPRPAYEYDADGRRGVEVQQVDVPRAGSFTVGARGGEEVYAIAIGRGRLDEELANDDAKLAGLLVLAIGVPLGVLLLVAGLARGSQHRRRRGPGSVAGYERTPWAPVPSASPVPPGPPTWGQPPPPPASGGGAAPGWGRPAPPSQPGSPNPPFPGP